ncbi:MAG: PQQ-binding-like beta-propeller repeat protein, partial [Pseudomonadota bacterium]
MFFACCLLAGCGPDFNAYHAITVGEARATSEWSAYGGPNGSKFAALEQIDGSNVNGLKLAWTYRTGEVAAVFQNTPVLAEGRLLLCTPFNEVVALDPLTGAELWVFDAQVDRNLRPANEFNCRSVTPARTDDSECPARVFMATNDARLLAINTFDGTPCRSFGENGEVALDRDVGTINWAGEYQVTSPPVMAGELVIVGSAVSDGGRVTAPSGVVRAFHAVSGELAWAFDLAPPDYNHDTQPVSSAGYALGTPNVWAPMVVDADRDMVFLPTGNPAPDYDRPPGLNMAHYGSAVVALRASTGEVLWHFNTVIKDFWDFDVPTQPVLADLEINGAPVPALIQATKMGHVFVLDRRTGEPIVDVSYQSVPVEGPLADRLSEVQPFPPPAFQTSRSYEPGESLFGWCDDMDAESVSGPVFTPITEQWTIGLPSNMGAINWGGVAVDEARGLMVVNTNSVPFRTKLIAREEASDLLSVMENPDATPDARRAARAAFDARYDLPPSAELATQRGADHLMSRHAYLDPVLGIPCSGAPMAELMVIDINAQQQTWRRKHGTTRDITMVPLPMGMPGMGGPLLTESGLIFLGAAAEKRFRAYDVNTGEELWEHPLPFPANATPMSYTVETAEGPRQFIVVAAGGDSRGGIGGEGDYLLAFALPQQQLSAKRPDCPAIQVAS